VRQSGSTDSGYAHHAAAEAGAASSDSDDDRSSTVSSSPSSIVKDTKTSFGSISFAYLLA